jgi:hypothetical protein
VAWDGQSSFSHRMRLTPLRKCAAEPILHGLLLTNTKQSYYATNIFVTVSLGLSRCSVLIFILRLTPIESHRHIAYGIIIATTLWTFGAVMAAALQCDPSQPWKLVGQQCPHVYTRLKAVCVIDAILEAALVACTCWLIRPLKTSLSNKCMVVFVFSFRLPLIVIIAFRLHTFNYNNLTTNFTFYESLYVTLTQTQVNYSLISATIPNLRPMIKHLNTHYGAMAESTITGSNSGSTSRSRNTTVRSVNNRKSRRRSSLDNMFPMSPLRKFSLKPKDSAHSGKKASGSGSGSGSGSRDPWDDMPDLVHVPSIGTQAVDTGSSVRIHAAREAEEGRVSSNTRDAEVMSTMSSESRRMMIRKEVDIHVETGGR